MLNQWPWVLAITLTSLFAVSCFIALMVTTFHGRERLKEDHIPNAEEHPVLEKNSDQKDHVLPQMIVDCAREWNLKGTTDPWKGCTVLTTNVKDEFNLSEFSSHYRLLGFDHIVIVDHRSSPPVSTKSLPPWLHVIRDEVHSIKAEILEFVCSLMKHLDAEWYMHVDADEYLWFPGGHSVQSFLHKHREYDMVAVNWLFFGSNFLHKNPNPGKLLPTFVRSESAVNKHVKTFQRPRRMNTHTHAHFASPKAGSKSIAAGLREWNVGPFCPSTKSRWQDEDAVLCHYVYQDYAELTRRKAQRVRDDSGTMREMPSKEVIDQEYNDVVNDSLAHTWSSRVEHGIQAFKLSL